MKPLVSIVDELEAIAEELNHDDGDLDRLNRNLVGIGKIIFARLDNIDAQLRQIVATLGPAAQPMTGIIALNGVTSKQTGEGTYMDTMKDNDPAGSLSVEWDDSKGAIVTDVTDAWSGDNDAVATVAADPNDASKGIVTPVGVGTVNVTVTGTNADGTTASATDSITVVASDAVGGTITLTPGTPAAAPAGDTTPSA